MKIVASLLTLLLLTGCSTLGYYAQAVGGHLDILSKRRSIEQVLADPQTPDDLRRKLQTASAARAYAVEALKLPDNGSYRDYADLQRDYVVWNVVAAPPLSVDPVRSCFLVVGCLSYRGYFDRQDAEAAAEQLRREGYDVYIGGASAYSTLGWFDDPLLNTLVAGSDERMLSTLFHELAHQRLYIKGAPEFNEAFAVAVAQEGVRRWYETQGQMEAYGRYVEAVERRRDFHGLLVRYRNRLADLYRSEIPDDEKITEKAGLFAEMREQYQLLRTRWGDYRGFDRWMDQDLNNAHLALVATYHELVPAFALLMAKSDSDLERFYGEAGQLGRMAQVERVTRLDALVAEARLLAPDNRLVLEDENSENPVN